MQSANLIYDGSFDGFLCCVFHVYDYKLQDVVIQKKLAVQHSFFNVSEDVVTDTKKADRVWQGLKKKLSSRGRSVIYYAFLSEQDGVENLLLEYVVSAYTSKIPIDKDFSNPIVLKITQIAKSVGREKHRMEAFVRFRLNKDDIYFATIEPDFDVLPLITKHFKRRYADQKWIIYDMRRQYGLFYDLDTVEIVQLQLPKQFNAAESSAEFFDEKELDFQQLWKDYFDSTNIPSRKNLKLHIRHVPKRYWKYLSEKQPNL